MDIALFKKEYSDILDRANRLLEVIETELSKLLSNSHIALGVPMEGRVKTWNSIEEKVNRKGSSLEHIEELDDLIGVRLILLFRVDLREVEKLIDNTFQVISSEDTATRLGEAQFGYQSQHYVIRLPEIWLKIPSMAELGDLKVEIQVRTLSQHIWAAASHKLQYKHKESVPTPLLRAIYRASALLETVDLEFDRILKEREKYKNSIPKLKGKESLNVDLLISTLSMVYPKENKMGYEDYEHLLSQLKTFSVNTVDELKSILVKHYDAVMKSDKEIALREKDNAAYSDEHQEKMKNGAYFTHTGLARSALTIEFGEKAIQLFTNDESIMRPAKTPWNR